MEPTLHVGGILYYEKLNINDFKENDNNNQIILDIADMNDYWGQDIDRSYVNINFKYKPYK